MMPQFENYACVRTLLGVNKANDHDFGQGLAQRLVSRYKDIVIYVTCNISEQHKYLFASIENSVTKKFKQIFGAKKYANKCDTATPIITPTTNEENEHQNQTIKNDKPRKQQKQAFA